MATTNDLVISLSALDRLKRELERLAEEQLEALRKSVFGGMTPAEASQYAERRAKINRLSKELAGLNKGQRVPG